MRFLVIVGISLSPVSSWRRPWSLAPRRYNNIQSTKNDELLRFSLSSLSESRHLLIRGGSDPSYGYEEEPYQQLQPQPYEDNYYNDNTYYTNEDAATGYNENYYPENADTTTTIPPTTDDPFHETVQDRVDRWKAAQAATSDANMLQQGPRDSQGRIKLLTSIGRGSRAFTFVLLIMRDLYFYERALNLSLFAPFRLVARLTIVSMLLLNAAGVVVSLTPSSSHSNKKRLKAILNLDKLIEIIAGINCFLRLLLPGTLQREQLIGSMFHSMFFLIQCHALTKFSWNEISAVPLSAYQTPGYRYQQQQQQQYQQQPY